MTHFKSTYFVLCVANKNSELKGVSALKRLRTTALDSSRPNIDIKIELKHFKVAIGFLFDPMINKN
jgi:hypothetical protein